MVPPWGDRDRLAGLVLYFYLYSKGGTGAIALGIGGLLGIIMMGNVHGIIWPNQKKVIAAVAQRLPQGTPRSGRDGTMGENRLMASRINFLLVHSHVVVHGGGEPPQVILEGGIGAGQSTKTASRFSVRLPKWVRFSYEFPLGRIPLGPWS